MSGRPAKFITACGCEKHLAIPVPFPRQYRLPLYRPLSIARWDAAGLLDAPLPPYQVRVFEMTGVDTDGWAVYREVLD